MVAEELKEKSTINTELSHNINKNDYDDYTVLGGTKIPALFVGNYSNIRGIICEDDIVFSFQYKRIIDKLFFSERFLHNFCERRENIIENCSLPSNNINLSNHTWQDCHIFS